MSPPPQFNCTYGKLPEAPQPRPPKPDPRKGLVSKGVTFSMELYDSEQFQHLMPEVPFRTADNKSINVEVDDLEGEEEGVAYRPYDLTLMHSQTPHIRELIEIPYEKNFRISN